jgi:hypothetical protein
MVGSERGALSQADASQLKMRLVSSRFITIEHSSSALITPPPPWIPPLLWVVLVGWELDSDSERGTPNDIEAVENTDLRLLMSEASPAARCGAFSSRNGLYRSTSLRRNRKPP